MRRDVILRYEGPAGREALTEVWLTTYAGDGERLEVLQLRPEFADAEWATWAAAGAGIVARGQQSLF